MIWLWIYLGGVGLRAFLVHGALQSATTAWSVDRQVLGCLIWPISLLVNLKK